MEHTNNIRLEVIKQFTLNDIDKVNIIKKTYKDNNLFIEKDIIECDAKMAKYLSGDNYKKENFIRVLEIIP